MVSCKHDTCCDVTQPLCFGSVSCIAIVVRPRRAQTFVEIHWAIASPTSALIGSKYECAMASWQVSRA